ncbi:TetR/AcrR family transcriptional regulator [Nocardioides marinus]|uniref:AcrR family transcriptional regulator n=1 Tax=Nocardioides marinus TaxID=374514 RepID=A0A7Z0C3J6_9ACTN|nr:TetR/AcrR family transcriptional regulator [Nocardioides marinus]NYI10342.1 AcrR family transcriptional regulator [Nocardioides marinus]
MPEPAGGPAASTAGASRREELLRIAADLFATKGFRNTTVRDIADAAGILSGSLYHHFDSKESMVDELMRTFQAELFAAYDDILASTDDARSKLERAVRLSFETIERRGAEVAIFQNEAATLGQLERFGYLAERNRQSRDVWVSLLTEGVESGALRSDLDITLTYRFIRDTVWVAVRWYRPGGPHTTTEVADQYLTILLDGIATSGGRAATSASEERASRPSEQGDSSA